MMRIFSRNFRTTTNPSTSGDIIRTRWSIVFVLLILSILSMPQSSMAFTALEKVFVMVNQAGKAMSALANGIEAAFNSGTRIYDNLTLREEKERLLKLSAGLSHLGMVQTTFVDTLKEFNEQPELERWESLTENSQLISEDVRQLIATLKAERSPLVAQGDAYDALLLTLQKRGATITQFQKIQPPLSDEDMAELHKIEKTYLTLLTELYRAKDALNQYLQQRFG